MQNSEKTGETQGPKPQTAFPRHGKLDGPAHSRRFTADRIIRMLVGLVVLVVALWFLWYFRSLVIYLLVGILLAYLMSPIVDRIQGIGVGRILAILTTFVLVFGAVTVLMTKLVPFAGNQLSELSTQLAFKRAAQVVAVNADSEEAFERGDLIVAVDGQPWGGFSQLQSTLRNKEAGDPVTFLIEGDQGRQRAEVVTLRGRPPGQERTESPPVTEDDTRVVETLGLTLREVAFSDVASSIERRLRSVLPVERGAIVGALTVALDQLFQEERLTQMASSVVGVFADIFYAVIVIPFVAFFVLKDGMMMRHSMLRLVPNRYFEMTLGVMEKVEYIIGRYFRALLVQCVSVAVVASILLWIVGLQYAVAVGVFTGLANTIPYFGPLMGFLAGTLVAVVQTGDFAMVPGILIAMGLTQLVDNIFFHPFIFSRAAQAHPVVILFVVLIGAQLAGIVGMLIAIPVATTVRVTIQQILWSLRNYRILRTA